MTNRDRWNTFTANLPSPENYLKWSLYSCIAMLLQRRVCIRSYPKDVYANMYIIPVGPPGTGKDAPISVVNSLLMEHYAEDVKPTKELSTDEQAVAKMTIDMEAKKRTEEMINGKNGHVMDKALAIPLAPNAVTYQALLQAMSKSLCLKDYMDYCPKLQRNKIHYYTHSSLAFTLGELGSLFRKHQNELVMFLIQAYDCDESYEYESISRQKDRIRRLCLNLLAGTTPKFIQSVFDERLTDEGLSSRTFFIFGNKPRKTAFFHKPLSELQLQARTEFQKHSKELIGLYGKVELESDTEAFLEAWLHQYQTEPKHRFSSSPKLAPFEARLNKHVMKVAMVRHFLENTSFKIPLQTFKDAIEDIRLEMKTMHYALTMEGDNPLAKSSNVCLAVLEKYGRMTFMQLLYPHMWSSCNSRELEEILEFLVDSGQVNREITEDEIDHSKVVKYKLREK